MENLLSDKDKQKLLNKKHKNNAHLLIIDKEWNGKVQPCVCGFDDTIHYYIEDSSTPSCLDSSIFSTEGVELAHIKEVYLRPNPKKGANLSPCKFNIELNGKAAGFIKIDALSVRVNMENFTKDWKIEYSDRFSLGYDYKYSVFKDGTEVGHFRSKVLHSTPFYILDYVYEADKLFLLILFMIHSVHTNKRQKEEPPKQDHLYKRTGLLGL